MSLDSTGGPYWKVVKNSQRWMDGMDKPEEEERIRMKAKGDLQMKEEEATHETGEVVGPFVSAMPTPVPNKSWAWEYFHLDLVRAGHHSNQYATCCLFGRQVSRGAVKLGTTALNHMKSMHREGLEKSGLGQAGQHQEQGPQIPMGIEGDWARLQEQVGTLTSWGREKDIIRREKAVEWWERVTVEEVKRAILEMEWKVRAEKEACLRETDQPAAAHPFHFV
ncbi:LOW QUALITY PROTEIN: zinc finger BED domain-containing protein 2 [Rhynchonycteris naso]